MKKHKINKTQYDENHDHNHDLCIEDALNKAEEICKKKGLRFTKIRKKVLELIWGSHKPLGAYDLLSALRAEGLKAEPPTVYRALGFLIEAELVHRLDSLNAFIGCVDPSNSHEGQFLICRECRSVAELGDDDIFNLVRAKASDLGFSDIHQMLEIQGQCQNCRASK